MDRYYLLFISPLVISFLVTPLVLKMALKSGVVDEPGGRKIHTGRKPLLGGLSLYIAILVSVLVFYAQSRQIVALLVGMSIIVIVGVIDDSCDLNPFAKLGGQFVAATVLLLMSAPSFNPVLRFLDGFLYFRFFSYALIAIWIVAIINAFNLIDGVDGLAIGSALIIGIFMVVLSLIYGNMWTFGISIILLGACLGFFPYNFQPARIFLGDTGSMLLGFILAAMFLFNVQYSVSMSLFFGAVFLFIYPVVDMSYAVFRRLRNRKPIFSGDREHIHHRMLRQGVPARYAVYIIYAGSFMLGVAGILVIRFPHWQVYSLIAIPMLIPLLYYLCTVLRPRLQAYLNDNRKNNKMVSLWRRRHNKS